jgi:8-oxo-dGTP pyrophosphatase MutT (NUDIX family)
MQKILQNLKTNVTNPLHLPKPDVVMAPKAPEKYRQPTPDATAAAVLICLYQRETGGELFLPLIKRRVVKGDKHSGQISLPGGRFEESDEDYMMCALRETQEEIGVPMNKVKVLGQLSELFVYASNFNVYPFIGMLQEKVEFVPETREVQSILEVPVETLALSSSIKKKDMYLREGVLKDVPYYDVQGEVVWGATAMILSEFLSYWKSSI